MASRSRAAPLRWLPCSRATRARRRHRAPTNRRHGRRPKPWPLGRLDARYEHLAGRLAGLAAELEDAAFETRTLADGVEHDPAALAAMEERLSFLFSLERKYGTDCEGLLERAERAADEVERLRGLEGEGIRRAGDATRLLEAVAAAAGALSMRRGAAARELGARIEQALGDLGLGETRVEIAVGRRPAGREEPAVEVDGDAVAFDATGIDVVVFLIAPNPGEPARPLAKVASGGELSRIALAIEEVLVDVDATPTLVFDEIDAGIGGRSADPVGRTLWMLGAPPPGPVRHAPAADRGPRRRALRDPQGAARRANRDRGPAPRRRGARARAGSDARGRRWRAGVRGVGPRAAGAGSPVPRQSRRPAGRLMIPATRP